MTTTNSQLSFEEAAYCSGFNFSIDKTMSGYYQLVLHNSDGTETLAHDDSAYEDVYDLESAKWLFASVIQESYWQCATVEDGDAFTDEDFFLCVYTTNADPAICEWVDDSERLRENAFKCKAVVYPEFSDGELDKECEYAIWCNRLGFPSLDERRPSKIFLFETSDGNTLAMVRDNDIFE